MDLAAIVVIFILGLFCVMQGAPVPDTGNSLGQPDLVLHITARNETRVMYAYSEDRVQALNASSLIPYDQPGAMTFAVAVVCLYGICIGLLIASSVKKTDSDDEVKIFLQGWNKMDAVMRRENKRRAKETAERSSSFKSTGSSARTGSLRGQKTSEVYDTVFVEPIEEETNADIDASEAEYADDDVEVKEDLGFSSSDDLELEEKSLRKGEDSVTGTSTSALDEQSDSEYFEMHELKSDFSTEKLSEVEEERDNVLNEMPEAEKEESEQPPSYKESMSEEKEENLHAEPADDSDESSCDQPYGGIASAAVEITVEAQIEHSEHWAQDSDSACADSEQVKSEVIDQETIKDQDSDPEHINNDVCDRERAIDKDSDSEHVKNDVIDQDTAINKDHDCDHAKSDVCDQKAVADTASGSEHVKSDVCDQEAAKDKDELSPVSEVDKTLSSSSTSGSYHSLTHE